MPATTKSQRTRQALLDATWALIGRDGVGAATVMAICEHAGIGRTSFYTYFPSAEEVIAEIADHAGQTFKTRFDTAHAGKSRGLERLSACLTMILTLSTDDRELALTLTSLAETDPALPELLAQEIAAELIGHGQSPSQAISKASAITPMTLSLLRQTALGRVNTPVAAQTTMLIAAATA